MQAHMKSARDVQPVEGDSSTCDEDHTPCALPIEDRPPWITRADGDVHANVEHLWSGRGVGAIGEHELIASAGRVDRGLQCVHTRRYESGGARGEWRCRRWARWE